MGAENPESSESTARTLLPARYSYGIVSCILYSTAHNIPFGDVLRSPSTKSRFAALWCLSKCLVLLALGLVLHV